LGSVLFSPSPHVLVAEWDGRLVGAVVPETVVLPDKRRGGLMLWLMTDPGTRGFGVGGRLVEAALRFFEERGCREVFACVEGFNTSSSSLFAAHGFTILSPGEQFRRYGLPGTFMLWLKTHRFGGDVGHFLWARPGTTKPDSPTLQWWVGAFVSVLIFLLAGWRGGWVEGFDPATILGGTAAIVTLYGLRQVVMMLAARFQGLSVRHRAWESGSFRRPAPFTLGATRGAIETSFRSSVRLHSPGRRLCCSLLGRRGRCRDSSGLRRRSSRGFAPPTRLVCR
jgi:GNAT superfamily N-acetyltransferase